MRLEFAFSVWVYICAIFSFVLLYFLFCLFVNTTFTKRNMAAVVSCNGRKCMALNALFFVCSNQQVSFENNYDMGRFAFFCNEVYEKLNTRFCFFSLDFRFINAMQVVPINCHAKKYSKIHRNQTYSEMHSFDV